MEIWWGKEKSQIIKKLAKCKVGLKILLGQSESIKYLSASHPHVLKLANPIKSCHLGTTNIQSSAN